MTANYKFVPLYFIIITHFIIILHVKMFLELPLLTFSVVKKVSAENILGWFAPLTKIQIQCGGGGRSSTINIKRNLNIKVSPTVPASISMTLPSFLLSSMTKVFCLEFSIGILVHSIPYCLQRAMISSEIKYT